MKDNGLLLLTLIVTFRNQYISPSQRSTDRHSSLPGALHRLHNGPVQELTVSPIQARSPLEQKKCDHYKSEVYYIASL
jgi:hypothetical protein